MCACCDGGSGRSRRPQRGCKWSRAAAGPTIEWVAAAGTCGAQAMEVDPAGACSGYMCVLLRCRTAIAWAPPSELLYPQFSALPHARRAPMARSYTSGRCPGWMRGVLGVVCEMSVPREWRTQDGAAYRATGSRRSFFLRKKVTGAWNMCLASTCGRKVNVPSLGPHSAAARPFRFQGRPQTVVGSFSDAAAYAGPRVLLDRAALCRPRRAQSKGVEPPTAKC